MKRLPYHTHPKLPLLLHSGLYEANLEHVDRPRFMCDDLVGATWGIYLDDERVGSLFDGRTYGWAQPHYTIRHLLWAGPFPEGYPQNPDARLGFDSGPFDSYQEALDKFAAQADALIQWRKNHDQNRR